MATEIDELTAYTGVVPDKDSQTQPVFDGAADTWITWNYGTFVPEMNTFVSQVNTVAQEVQDASDAAVGAANYQGDWTALANVLTGQSYSYGGGTWIAKQNSVGVTPVEGTYWLKGVGTAAYLDVTTSQNDTTLNRALKVGDAGLLAGATVLAPYLNPDTIATTTFFNARESVEGGTYPVGVSEMWGINIYSSSIYQTQIVSSTPGGVRNSYIREMHAGTWGAWGVMYSSNQNATATEINSGTSSTTVITPLALASSNIANQSFCVGKTVTDVTGSRFRNTVYTNTDTNTRWVSIYVDGDIVQKIKVDGVVVCEVNAASGVDTTLTAPVPPNSTYEFEDLVGGTIQRWVEI